MKMKIHFTASDAPEAQTAFLMFKKAYGQEEDPAKADVFVPFGGDGQTIKTLVLGIKHRKPVMALNRGHLGHLTNVFTETEGLVERIRAAEAVELSPLRINATFLSGDIRTDFAINEANVCHDFQGEAIYLRVFLDGVERLRKLGADGILISTTIGSTAYNKSARGPILPLGDDMLAFTPNNAFVPDRMRACVIRPAPIRIEVHDPTFRKAQMLADSRLIGTGLKEVSINLDTKNKFTLLFDRGYSLSEKVMRTQFPEPC